MVDPCSTGIPLFFINSSFNIHLLSFIAHYSYFHHILHSPYSLPSTLSSTCIIISPNNLPILKLFPPTNDLNLIHSTNTNVCNSNPCSPTLSRNSLPPQPQAPSVHPTLRNREAGDPDRRRSIAKTTVSFAIRPSTTYICLHRSSPTTYMSLLLHLLPLLLRLSAIKQQATNSPSTAPSPSLPPCISSPTPSLPFLSFPLSP